MLFITNFGCCEGLHAGVMAQSAALNSVLKQFLQWLLLWLLETVEITCNKHKFN